jgi:hypothetical protein
MGFPIRVAIKKSYFYDRKPLQDDQDIGRGLADELQFSINKLISDVARTSIKRE